MARDSARTTSRPFASRALVRFGQVTARSDASAGTVLRISAVRVAIYAASFAPADVGEPARAGLTGMRKTTARFWGRRYFFATAWISSHFTAIKPSRMVLTR